MVIICQELLIVYGTVHWWQWNQITFLIAKKGVDQFLSDVLSFFSSLSLAQKLESKCSGKKKKSLQNCPYKSMCICVCTHMERVSILLRTAPLMRKTGFIPAEHGSVELLAPQWPYLCNICICCPSKSISTAPHIWSCCYTLMIKMLCKLQEQVTQ